MEKLQGLKNLNKSDTPTKTRYQFDNISKRDIAIIGIAGKFGSAESVQEFWEGLKVGKDFVCQIPEERKGDCESYLKVLPQFGMDSNDYEYMEAGYLNRIDGFDCGMFNISPKEADLMDPHQRLFLETAWEAIEDAGYGGKKIVGSRTGVYIGHSTDFGEDYKRYSRMLSNTTDQATVVGNIRSIIGSRISYILDLKGPSVTIDTACSSVLVAVHNACQAIRNNECDMAIAGGVNVLIVPLRDKKGRGNLGIESSNARAKTFDNRADGTGAGEGVGAVILKPLSKAIEEGDHIYAVIKGSAINQDGSSVGITAPNMAAQEEVILRAWKDADINPETITYIETHGTGTSLGDPIEISGIQRAFENYTNKKQFCAVASVKSNIAHLDNAAGIVSLTKAVMALKHKQLPPSIHFQSPNRKIVFEQSPVYVNDRLKDWESDSPNRCGISAFGLSGTNCHLILEEYVNANEAATETKSPQIFTMSAKNKESLKMLIERYDEFLDNEKGIENICYTANTGRGHYNLRLTLIVESTADLKEKIKILKTNGIESNREKRIFFKEHKIIAPSKQTRLDGEITDSEKKNLTYEADSVIGSIMHGTTEYGTLELLSELYIKGADVEWEKLYQKKHKKISLPVYPFLKERHWIEPQKVSSSVKKEENMLHPLIHKCLADSMGLEIYSTKFSVENHWVLNEHKVAGVYILPGTTYIQMIKEVALRNKRKGVIEMKEVIFIAPFAAEQGVEVEAHTIVKEEAGHWEFVVVSKSGLGESWIKHSEGKFFIQDEKDNPKYDISELKKRCKETDFKFIPGLVDVGPRFQNMKEIYLGNGEALAYLELPEEYLRDLEEYSMHPALLDTAVNMANGTIGEGLYLPLSYKNLRIYGDMPKSIYCYMIRNQREKDNKETATFDISLMDINGNIFAAATDYTVKRVHDEELKSFDTSLKGLDFYESGWMEKRLEGAHTSLNSGAILVIKDSSSMGDEIVSRFKEKGQKVYEVEIGNSEDGYKKMLSGISGKLGYVIYLSTNSVDVQDLNTTLDNSIYSLFYLTRALVNQKFGGFDLVLIGNNANEVTKAETKINPHNSALFALGKVVEKECPGLKVRCIDIDESVSPDDIISELTAPDTVYHTAYRNGVRFAEEFRRINVKGLESSEVNIKSEGVYVITGGAGGIGLEIAKYLSTKNKVNLCFINRSPMPEREIWEDILKENKDSKLCRKINSIKTIEESGSQVVHYSGDVSNEGAIKPILDELRQNYGKINAIIHAAGVAGDGFILRKDIEVFSQVIAPKVNGTWVLDKLTENDKLDFFVMFSSISSLLAAPGQGDYTAANAYMDAYAKSRAKQGKRTLSINWPAWRETGMAVDYNAVDENSLFKPISTAVACKVFERLLGYSITNAIPAEINYKVIDYAQLPLALSDEIKQVVENRKAKSVEHESKDINDINVTLKGKITQDYTETEQEIAKMWALVLGANEVDVFDNFNDLGGDSILATQLLKEMQKRFSGLVDIADIFTYSTISEMAGYIDGKRGKKKEFEKIEEVVLEVDEDDDTEFDDVLGRLASGNMSVEEAKKLIDLGDDD